MHRHNPSQGSSFASSSQYRHFPITREPDFTKIVLGWSVDRIYDGSLDCRHKIPATASSIVNYYANFKPAILEEARAIIAEGLIKCSQSDMSFELKLSRDATLPKNEGNPMGLSFYGQIPREIEHGPVMNVLLLESRYEEYRKQWIGIANEEIGGNRKLVVKIIAMPDEFEEYEKCFQEGGKWTANYLGSLVSEERMYSTCVSAVQSPCLPAIMSGRINGVLPGQTHDVLLDDLNVAQSHAIQSFLSAAPGTVVLLQGPPGTGKTTVVAHLLKKLDARRERTMICAHSNKGVQVLAEKTMQFIPEAKMILVGVEKKIPDHLKLLSLTSWHQEISNHFSDAVNKSETIYHKIQGNCYTPAEYNKYLSELKTEITLIERELNKFDFLGFQSHFGELKAHRTALKSTVIPVRLQAIITNLNRLMAEWNSKDKGGIEKQLLQKANIIFITLVSAGRRIFSDMPDIDVLLVDEAAQSVEAATLIPMQYKPKKILLVGDPEQLPATVISPINKPGSGDVFYTNYDRSMMSRLIKYCRAPYVRLTVQYRMHPQICRWPSLQYYDNELVTAPMLTQRRALSQQGLIRRPYTIYQVEGDTQYGRDGRSVSNDTEATYVLKIVRHIRFLGLTQSIGVVTPYVAQRQRIYQKLQSANLLDNLEVSTVDGFQGDEEDIVIVSFVRNNVTEFLKDCRRLNVAVTRAKYCLIVLADPRLNRHDIGQLIEHAGFYSKSFSQAVLNQELAQYRQDQPHPAWVLGKQCLAENNFSAAKEQFLIAAQNNDADSFCALGNLYLLGEGVTQDKLEAIKWYEQAVKLDHPEACYQLAKHRMQNSDQQAFHLLRFAAEHGHMMAQHEIGGLYLLPKNQAIKKDCYLGEQWLIQAYMQGHVASALTLAAYFDKHSQFKESFTWIKKAADYADGLPEAQYKVAICYQQGRGINRSPQQAVIYFEKAAMGSYLQAYFPLAELLRFDRPQQAIKWYRKSAHLDNPESYFKLAELLMEAQEFEEAITWYEKSAILGDLEANYRLADGYHHGKYQLVIDIPKALTYYHVSASGNHRESLYQLALLYESGREVNQDMQRANDYYRHAAVLQHPLASIRYSLSYRRSDVCVQVRQAPSLTSGVGLFQPVRDDTLAPEPRPKCCCMIL